MCGRYFQYGTKQEIAEFVRARRITSETIAPNYNESPTTRQPILRVDRETGERELVLMDWSKQKYFPAYATINARGEQLLASNMWKTFMRKGQRCCAVMSGFYEFLVVEMLPLTMAAKSLAIGTRSISKSSDLRWSSRLGSSLECARSDGQRRTAMASLARSGRRKSSIVLASRNGC